MDLFWLWALSLNKWIAIPSFFVGIGGLTFLCYPVGYRLMHWVEGSDDTISFKLGFGMFFFAFLMSSIYSRELLQKWHWLVIFAGIIIISLFAALFVTLTQRFLHWYFREKFFSRKKRIASSLIVGLIALLFIYSPR